MIRLTRESTSCGDYISNDNSDDDSTSVLPKLFYVMCHLFSQIIDILRLKPQYNEPCVYRQKSYLNNRRGAAPFSTQNEV